MAFLGNAPVTKNFDAFEDLAKVAKVPYNALKERIVSAMGAEDSSDIAREILNGILAKIVAKDFSEIIDAGEDLVKFYKKYQGVVGGFGGGIGSGIGDEDISDVAREILDEILGKEVTEDFGENVDTKEDLVKLCKEYQEVVGGVVGGIVGGIIDGIGIGIIGSGMGDEDIGDVARGILYGILVKVVTKDFGGIVNAEEDLVKLCKKYQGVVGGVVDGIISSGMGNEDISDVAREILGKIVTEDFGEIVNAKKNRIKAFLAKFDNSTDTAEFEVVENVKNTNIRYRCILKFKSNENATNSFSAVKKSLSQAKEARCIREIQAIRQVRRDIYRGISANDLPQFHRQIFQQNSEDLIQGKEDLAKIEQGFQEDAKFDLAKWTNECFGNSSARVPLYARGKDTKNKGKTCFLPQKEIQ